MVPTLRVDDDVYDKLKDLAEPFVDTPNTVLRRVLKLDGAESAPKQKRARAGELLHRFEYQKPLLAVLSENGGSMAAKDAVDAVGERLKDRLRPRDLEPISSGMIRWRNRVQWTRNALR